MGLNLKQFIESLKITNKKIDDTKEDLTRFVLDEDEKLNRTVNAKVQAAVNVFSGEEPFQSVKVVDEQVGIQDSPIGTILTYMGNRAPQHYLICDGTEYQIADYPLLADHFLREFEAVNYFGGDGETTFCVPDLRGEFLRGSGTATRATGIGANVGVHQDGTVHPNVFPWNNNIQIFADNNSANGNLKKTIGTNYDVKFGSRTYTVHTNGKAATFALSNNDPTSFTSRPTNTSVLYCIKYEATQYMTVGPQSNRFSTDEIIVGTWIDGKPIYQKVVTMSNVSASGSIVIPCDLSDVDQFVDMVGHMTEISKKETYPMIYPHKDSIYVSTFRVNRENDAYVLKWIPGTGWYNRPMNLAITVKYTKL